MKVCTTCNNPRPISAFSYNRHQIDKRSLICKECQVIRNDKPDTRNKRIKNSRRSSGLLLATHWQGYSDWSQITASHKRWRGNSRTVQGWSLGLHALDATTQEE